MIITLSIHSGDQVSAGTREKTTWVEGTNREGDRAVIFVNEVTAGEIVRVLAAAYPSSVVDIQLAAMRDGGKAAMEGFMKEMQVPTSKLT